MTAESPTDSGEVLVKVTEPASARTAHELEQALDLDAKALEIDVDETLESLDPVTVISFAISGVEMAHRVWKWWRSRGASTADVKLVRPDGTELHFSNLSEDELVALVGRVVGG